jgi:hypothetical protein
MKYLQKLLKMPSKKAWVERPSSLIKRGERAEALKARLRNYLIKVEIVLEE